MDTAKVVKTAPIDTKKQVLESKGADNTATPVEPSKVLHLQVLFIYEISK
jgi:hypothetical protein